MPPNHLRALLRATDVFWRDLRYSARGLRRSPGFTIAVTLTLGLGIGANTAMLGTINRLMFSPFPYLRDPGSVHRVYFQTAIRGRMLTRSAGPYTRYLDIERSTTSFSEYAAFTEWPLAIGYGAGARERIVAGVSASFFHFFNAGPRVGRFFGADEDARPRGANVAVLGYGYWQTELGGQSVIGRPLQVGPLVLTIIGVAPRGFTGVSEGEAPAVFIPITTIAFGMNQGDAQSFPTSYKWDWMNVMVRRKPGVTVTTATADLTNAFIQSRERQRSEFPNTAPVSVAHPRAVTGALRTLAGPDAGLEARTLFWVTGVAAVVLLVACANMANLLLARLLRRRREIAVRRAMGVSGGRLLAQFVADGVLLAALGCAAGVLVAQAVNVALTRLSLGGASLNWRSLFLAAALALAAGVLAYAGPALVAIRGAFADSLRSGARAGTHHHARLQSALLVVQGALSVTLLVGAGLFVKSLENARSLELGWDPEPVLVATPNYRGVAMDSSARDGFRRRLLATARAIPGVDAAARVSNLPFLTSTMDLHVDGIDSVARLGRFVYLAVSPEYFKVVGTRILRGRPLNDHDRADASPVAVVSESMGRALWPGRDPIGECLHLAAGAPCTTVVGVAEDAVQTSLSDDQRFMYYVSDDQGHFHPENRIFLRMQAAAAGGWSAASFGDAVRRALQRVMPGAAYVTVAPLEDMVDKERRSWTLGATMFAAFGGLALLVAAVGLYGVISYQAAQRGHEISVRVALGAQATHIVRLVVGQGMALSAAGVAGGLLVAWGAARWLQPLLFHESATDVSVYGIVGGVVAAVALAASAVPAARAVRADPTEALKNE